MNPIDNIIQITRDLCEAEARVQELRQALEDVCAAMAKPNGTPEPEEKPKAAKKKASKKKPARRHKRKGRRERMRKGTMLVELFYRSGEYAIISRRCALGTPGRYMRNGDYFQGVWLTEDERAAVCAQAVESKRGAGNGA